MGTPTKELANQPTLSKSVRTLQLQPEEQNGRPTDVEISEESSPAKVEIPRSITSFKYRSNLKSKSLSGFLNACVL